ncbi:MAG TPA: diadenylate cyclase CdaA [Thermoanaerobaculia bacterium]|jgi:diadenylate cyclase|nr:diadenylate cyclase CdaA [Thermoanaerobaculia bacterium]
MNVFDRFLSLSFTWRDAIDIAIVTLIIYSIFSLVRGTRAMQISLGLIILGSTFFVARAFELSALEVISRQILFYIPFAVIVLFQQEIRRALARMVGDPLALFFRRPVGEVPIDPILHACDFMSAKQMGALIAIEGRQTLRAYEDGAKPVDAVVTNELLVAIFTPGGPLHDGAAIVRGNRIVAANAFLPLTTTPDPTLAHGTRHRAAIGLSEESDAVVIVISEENGSIAVAADGVLREHLDRTELRGVLQERFGVAR